MYEIGHVPLISIEKNHIDQTMVALGLDLSYIIRTAGMS